jgi:hypothetical protein
MVAWATAFQDNNIMELQLQGIMVGEMHKLLYEGATVSQETVLPNQNRTDITLIGEKSLIVLELKKQNSETPPTMAKKSKYHDQLRGYVAQREAMEEQKPEKLIVAGFLGVMFDDGRQYTVEKVK